MTETKNQGEAGDSSSGPVVVPGSSESPALEISDGEGSIRIGKNYLVFPKFPAECGYVRIVDAHTLSEKVYWDQQEWADEPAEVMGAIIGAMCQGVESSLSDEEARAMADDPVIHDQLLDMGIDL